MEREEFKAKSMALFIDLKLGKVIDHIINIFEIWNYMFMNNDTIEVMKDFQIC